MTTFSAGEGLGPLPPYIPPQRWIEKPLPVAETARTPHPWLWWPVPPEKENLLTPALPRAKNIQKVAPIVVASDRPPFYRAL